MATGQNALFSTFGDLSDCFHGTVLLAVYDSCWRCLPFPGAGLRLSFFLYSVTLFGKLIWYLYLMLQSPSYFGNHILETINNFTLCFASLGSQAMGEMSRNVQTSMLLLLRLLNVFRVLFKVKQLFMNIPHKSGLRLVY